MRKGTAKGGNGSFDWGALKSPNKEMGDWKVADRTISQLTEQRDKPLFLACGFYRPHLPWYVPQHYFDLYPLESITLPAAPEDDLDDVPSAGRKMADPSGDHVRIRAKHAWRPAVQGYLASISFVDECVGRVIDALDASSRRENTIIVLWSDHGWHLGEKQHWRKSTLWEEASRSVLMIIAPGTTTAGTICDAPVSLGDIYPTLIDLCGLEPRKGLEGLSLRPLLEDPQAEWDRPALTTFGYRNHSIRSRRWRYIRYADGTEELYDHSVDSDELRNLAANPEFVEIKQGLMEWLPATDVRNK